MTMTTATATKTVKLTVLEGSLKGQEFLFNSPTTCTIGRAYECNLQLPNDQYHSDISRYHCVLNINPPEVRIRDLGSRHGTYVNGQKIGQRSSDSCREEAQTLDFPEYQLKAGDVIQLSDLVFEVGLSNYSSQTEAIHYTPSISNETVNLVCSYPQPQKSSKKPNLLELVREWIQLVKVDQKYESLIPIPGYHVEKKLGQGSFGEVYLARQQRTGNFVALKLLLPESAANQHHRNKFLRELENTKALKHPHVVELLDYGFSDDTFFFTLEYCDGGTVDDYIRRKGRPLSVEEAMPMIFQVLDGLEYAHNAEIPYVKLANGKFAKGKGLVHRDIKPSNLLVKNAQRQPIVKIADFGVAKAFDRAGLSGFSASGADLEGTFYFMPREQILNFKYAKPSVDVWATAACLYYMLTGTLPRDFRGKEPLLAVLQTNPIPIRQRNRSIPKKLAEVIDLALVDHPQVYYKSATELKEALQNAL